MDFGARIYDPRLGRFLSVDPLAPEFPSESNYIYAGNSPLIFIDQDGEKKIVYLDFITKSGRQITVKLVYKDDIRIDLAATASETVGTVRIKDIEQHITINLATGERFEGEEKVVGTYTMGFSAWLGTLDNLLSGSGDVQFGGIYETSPNGGADPTKNTSKSHAEELSNMQDLLIPDVLQRGIPEAVEKMGEVNRDLKVIIDIFQNSIEASQKTIDVVEKIAKGVDDKAGAINPSKVDKYDTVQTKGAIKSNYGEEGNVDSVFKNGKPTGERWIFTPTKENKK